MDTPGVSVRPLLDMNGEHDLSEVMFEDARIPATNLVGVEGRGWYQVTETLGRARSGIETFAEGKANIERLVAAAKDEASLITRSPNARYEIADRWIELEVGYTVACRVPYLQAQGQTPTHEASVSKLYGSELTQRIANTGMHLLGLAGQTTPGSPYARLRRHDRRRHLRDPAQPDRPARPRPPARVARHAARYPACNSAIACCTCASSMYVAPAASRICAARVSTVARDMPGGGSVSHATSVISTPFGSSKNTSRS